MIYLVLLVIAAVSLLLVSALMWAMDAVYGVWVQRPAAAAILSGAAGAAVLLLTHWSARHAWSPCRRAVLAVAVVAVGLSFAFLLPRHLVAQWGLAATNRYVSSVVAFLFAVLLLTTFWSAALVAVALGSRQRGARLEMATALMLAIKTASWAAAFVFGVFIVALAVTMTARLPWVAVVAAVATLPVIGIGMARYLEVALLHAAGVSDASRLLAAVERVTAATSVRFRRVFVLGGPLFDVTYCAVYWLPLTGHVLVSTGAVLERLTEQELLAMVAHEAEHVRGRHALKGAGLDALLGGVIVLITLVLPSRPGSFLQFAAPLMAIALLRQAVRQRLLAHFEESADRLSVEIAGRPALESGLQKFSGSGAIHGSQPFRVPYMARGTVHSRIARIRPD